MRSILVGLLVLVGACGDTLEAAPPATPSTSSHSQRAPASSSATNKATSTTPPSHASESCGELAMTRAGLIEKGQGEKHPERVGVDALLAQCTDATPSPEACRRVGNELTESTARGYGENHPNVRSLRAKQALCPK